MRIFLSSTRNDWDLARDLARRLRGMGLHVFTDEKVEEPGEELVQLLQRRLRTSDEVIFLLTQNSIASEKIMFEIGAALSLRKKITPIIVGVDADKLPPMIKHLPHVRYAEVTDYLAKLKKRNGAPVKVHA
ncbi:toll/interleukin-1 receptor domain-containing protein [candidate division KSB1 bacterium]|nr:toll/interleukin-1 receptor domain-containing protein [candidate division KSB1 bacterium]